MGSYAEAERLYRLALAVEPDSVPALTNLGVVLSRQGKYPAAIAAYQRVLRLDPTLTGVKLNLALAYYHSADWEKAARWLRAVLVQAPDNRSALQLLPVCLLELERFEQAARAYEKLLPSDDVSILVGAATAYLKTGRREKGEALLARALSERGGSAEVHFMVGQAQLAVHEYAAAEQSFRRMLELAPGQREGRFYLGGAYLKHGKEDVALAEWRKTAEDEPNYFPAVFAVGAVLAGKREYSEARQWLARAAALDPNHAFTRFELGRIAHHEKKHAEAERELRAATKLAPELREASYLLASTYRQLGKTEAAKREAARGARLYRETRQRDVDLLKQALGGPKP